MEIIDNISDSFSSDSEHSSSNGCPIIEIPMTKLTETNTTYKQPKHKCKKKKKSKYDLSEIKEVTESEEERYSDKTCPRKEVSVFDSYK